MHQASKAPLQFEERCNSAGHGQRAQRQGDRRRQVGRRKKTKTGEQQRKPKDEESDERFWQSPAQSAGRAAIVCLRSWPQGSLPELTTIDRGDLQVSRSAACPRAAAAVRKLTD